MTKAQMAAKWERWREIRRRQRARHHAIGAKHLSWDERTRNHQRRWTRKDDQSILAKNRPGDRELALLLRRTTQAISVRRAILRKRARAGEPQP